MYPALNTQGISSIQCGPVFDADCSIEWRLLGRRLAAGERRFRCQRSTDLADAIFRLLCLRTRPPFGKKPYGRPENRPKTALTHDDPNSNAAEVFHRNVEIVVDYGSEMGETNYGLGNVRVFNRVTLPDFSVLLGPELTGHSSIQSAGDLSS
jgi:hypothetical protein